MYFSIAFGVLGVITCFLAAFAGKLQSKLIESYAEIDRLKGQVTEMRVPEFTCSDVISAARSSMEDEQRLVGVEFRSHAGVLEFHRWLNTQLRYAKLHYRLPKKP